MKKIGRDAIRLMTKGVMSGATQAGSKTASSGDSSGNAEQTDGAYLILACDGGGIRGLLTALILERLDRESPFINRVNLFAGTSSGGIIALGLAKGMSPGEVVSLFRNDGPTIFGEKTLAAPAGAKNKMRRDFDRIESESIQRLRFSPRQLLHSKFQNDGMGKVLKAALGPETTFANLSPRSALVTTLQLSSKNGWVPLVLHNLETRVNEKQKTRVEDQPTMNTKLVDAAMATSAAPLYFPPYSVPTFGYCIDGGFVANCPAAIAYSLATAFVPEDQRKTMRVLSIGTGAPLNQMTVPSSPFNSAEEYGAVAWLSPISRGTTPAFPLISALFDASSAAHNYICQATPGMDYKRIQVTLTKSISLDDATKAALDAIATAANGWIAGPEFEQTVEWLKSS